MEAVQCCASMQWAERSICVARNNSGSNAMKFGLIKNVGLGVALVSAAAVAQGQDVVFPGFGAAQVRELNSVASIAPFGGTYLGVSLAEIDDNRAKELKLKEDY